MADIRYYDVILKPVVTEKSMDIMADKKYTFLVHPEANKAMIKEAVEKMFPGTEVKTVNTMNNDGKTKRRGRTEGKTVKTKKAMVTLTENSKEIEGFAGLYFPQGIFAQKRDNKCCKGEQSWESKSIPHIHRPEEI